MNTLVLMASQCERAMTVNGGLGQSWRHVHDAQAILCAPLDRLEDLVTESRILVVVVDDDESVRESLPDLLEILGFKAKAFASAEEFLLSGCVADARCLILDIAMPGMSGPELHRELIRQGRIIPTIFITAQPQSVRTSLLQQGAVECLFKPFSDRDLRAALAAALPKG